MNIQKINCPACGATIQVNEDTNTQVCDYCKTNFTIESKDGVLTTRLAKNVEKVIKDLSENTGNSIRESSQVTQNELKKIQLQQQIANLQNQLSIINSEIRGLERSKRNRKQKKQLRELKIEKIELAEQIKKVESELYEENPGFEENKRKNKPNKSLKKNPKWIIVVGLILLIILCAILNFPTKEEENLEPTVDTNLLATQIAATLYAQIAPTLEISKDVAQPTEISSTTSQNFLSPGTYLVETEMQPGIYKGKGSSESCYWARLKDLSGEFDAIIANDIATGQFYVEVKSSDFAFETRCEVIPLDSLQAPTGDLPTIIQAGTYLVGRDIRPGMYKGQAEGTSCYWARLNSVAGDLNSIITNNIAEGQFYVQVDVSDFALTTACALERVGD